MWLIPFDNGSTMGPKADQFAFVHAYAGTAISQKLCNILHSAQSTARGDILATPVKWVGSSQTCCIAGFVLNFKAVSAARLQQVAHKTTFSFVQRCWPSFMHVLSRRNSNS